MYIGKSTTVYWTTVPLSTTVYCDEPPCLVYKFLLITHTFRDPPPLMCEPRRPDHYLINNLCCSVKHLTGVDYSDCGLGIHNNVLYTGLYITGMWKCGWIAVL